MSQYFRNEEDILDEYDTDIDGIDYSNTDFEKMADFYECECFYYNELKNLPNPRKAKINELYQRAIRGNNSAREALIESHLNMVVEIAKHYTNRGADFDDLVQEGNMALINAIETYVYKANLGISSYIRQAIYHHLSRFTETTGKPVRIPSHTYEHARQIKRAKDRLIQQNHKRPTYQEIADHLRMTYEEVAYIHCHAGDYLVENEDDTNFKEEYFQLMVDSDSPALIDQFMQKDLHEKLQQKMRNLTPREEKVLILRFGLNDGNPKTLYEVGLVLNVTTERVRQIEAKAIRKMRVFTRSNYWRSILYYIDKPESPAESLWHMRNMPLT